MARRRRISYWSYRCLLRVKAGWTMPSAMRSSWYAALTRLVRRGSVKAKVDERCGRKKIWSLTKRGEQDLANAQDDYGAPF